KAALLYDVRIDQLQALSTIDILPSNQLNKFRNALASLRTAGSLFEKDLLADPVPGNSDFQPNHEDLTVPASQRLEQLENKLEKLVIDWQRTLLENLEDPVTHDSLNLLSSDERSQVDTFIDGKSLPQPVEEGFVKALRQVLQGLVPVELSGEQIQQALFGQGSAATVEQLKARLDKFLAEQCRGQDVSKVRIVLK
ncbi:MAG: ATP-binding protein, partial [Candidatus Marinimicrobia bacterium]|nr:ATP-binding protein [Candidatus Neomarinimicrobiota bacterium]